MTFARHGTLLMEQRGSWKAANGYKCDPHPVQLCSAVVDPAVGQGVSVTRCP